MVGAATLMTLWASGAAAQRLLTSSASRLRSGEQDALPAPESGKVQSCIPECDSAVDESDDADEGDALLDSRAQYAHAIQTQIHRRCRYPREKARGVAVVSFAVSSAGKLMEACVSRSSGNRELDVIALESVQGAGLFPPTPTGAEMRFSAPFQFR